MKKVGIIGGARIPFCRSMTNYTSLTNRELLTASLKALVSKYNLKENQVSELIAGAVLKRSRDFSLARESGIDAGLGFEISAVDVQQACGTSLQAAMILASKIQTGIIESGIAAGVDTSSDIPIEFSKNFSDKLLKFAKAKKISQKLGYLFSIRPGEFLPKIPAVAEPRTGLSMGEHCELMVKEWNIGRQEQDELAFLSHQKASKAQGEGFFDKLVFPFNSISKDNNVRAKSSLDSLSKLSPVFDKSSTGTLTAGNSSPLTDGAASVLIGTDEFARKNGFEIESYISHYQSAGIDYVEKEGLLMAPVYAVSQMLERAGLELQDFDYYEIHEAFAGQVLCTLKAWESDDFCRDRLGRKKALGKIDRSKLNVSGSSIALGHPFAATGARILATASQLLKLKGSGRALISICTAGGMGVCAILER